MELINQTEEEIRQATHRKMGLEDTLEQVHHVYFLQWFSTFLDFGVPFGKCQLLVFTCFLVN